MSQDAERKSEYIALWAGALATMKALLAEHAAKSAAEKPTEPPEDAPEST